MNVKIKNDEVRINQGKRKLSINYNFKETIDKINKIIGNDLDSSQLEAIKLLLENQSINIISMILESKENNLTDRKGFDNTKYLKTDESSPSSNDRLKEASGIIEKWFSIPSLHNYFRYLIINTNNGVYYRKHQLFSKLLNDNNIGSAKTLYLNDIQYNDYYYATLINDEYIYNGNRIMKLDNYLHEYFPDKKKLSVTEKDTVYFSKENYNSDSGINHAFFNISEKFIYEGNSKDRLRELLK